MRVVGIKVLKNKTSEYVRLAASGETVLVTDRDRVVAELGPPSAGRAPAVGDAQLAELMRRGLLRPPLVASTEPPSSRPVRSLAKILAGLAEDRGER